MSEEMNDMTMADFEKEINGSFRAVNPGDILTGTVIGVSDTEVTLDLNYFAEGIIKIDELSNDPRFSIKGDVAVGDEIRAVVIREDRNGNILLSKKQADNILAWDKLKEMQSEKKVVSVKVASSTNAGVITYLEGIRAFIPASKLAVSYVENTEEYVGKTLDVIVITVNEADQKLVLSAKDVLFDREREERNSKIARIPVGTVTEGTVERIEQYGAFVSIGNDLQGLLHISQICDKRLKTPREVLEIGQKVKVKIIDVKDGKLSLSMKAVDEKDEVEEEVNEAPAEYMFGDDEPVTMAGLFAGIKLKK
ncbi:MAG: S1 RNA-binding domain-containing protein [Lachnospiraceae bacterium]|nr:S1 RNA-binding domain-containing protein [Lachnospiraceae bacterium]